MQDSGTRVSPLTAAQKLAQFDQIVRELESYSGRRLSTLLLEAFIFNQTDKEVWTIADQQDYASNVLTAVNALRAIEH